jgi:hypothetical protein
MKQLLKMMAMGLLLGLLSMSYVQAQSLTPAEPIRNGSLGDPSVEAAGYDAHKAQFVAENPEQYNEMIGTQVKDNTKVQPWGAEENKERWAAEHPREYAELQQAAADNRTRVSRADFNALPVAKQQAMQNDPKFLIID